MFPFVDENILGYAKGKSDLFTPAKLRIIENDLGIVYAGAAQSPSPVVVVTWTTCEPRTST